MCDHYDSSLEAAFELNMQKRLERMCYQTRACKDSSKECIVLMNNKRVSIYGRDRWSSELYAKRAVERYISNDKHWYTSTNSVYQDVMGDNKVIAPTRFRETAKKIRAEWVRKHLKIIPLRDYMAFEYKRAKASKK